MIDIFSIVSHLAFFQNQVLTLGAVYVAVGMTSNANSCGTAFLRIKRSSVEEGNAASSLGLITQRL
jgi:hypothetical protein